MSKLFVSHSSKDDDFVRELQRVLGDLHQDVWIDSRQLRGGDPLWPEIQKAIESASAFAIVVSPGAFESTWVGKELRHALELQKQRGTDKFPVIPLSLDGTQLGVLEQFFGEEPIFVPVRSTAGGADAAVHPILVALGKRLPADAPTSVHPPAELLEELVLELTDLKILEQEGKRRPTAKARLVYEPAATGQREVASAQSWRFMAPLGPIEAEEIRWYLEKYAIWPSEYFRDRARKVEQSLVQWGQLLHQAALPVALTANVMNAWAKVDGHAQRRFSVHVDASLVADAPEADVQMAREASTLLLGLPWELLHNGDTFLFQGAKPTRVRRRLPNTRDFDAPVVATPIRILLVTARPEDDACGYIDHRASALPLVEAVEALGGLVQLHVLNPPNLAALREELDRARAARKPYHVVHFDGHGVYDRRVGLGALCFEEPQDLEKLAKRRHKTVTTEQLGPLLNAHRIALVFLEACQTAQAEKASESVASELLKVGVASVVAMSHSVLVETARRFVQAFYKELAQGARVGQAMLEGQRQLKDDNFRGSIFGAGELRLEDWFVPVLFQEKADPQLFYALPALQTQEDIKSALKTRMGQLPAKPDTGFIGRSRELLALQRLLGHRRYAVIRGQGGEGKTALAAECARWMVRSQQVRRAAFVSVEAHTSFTAVLDAIGQQLVQGYSVATFDDFEKAIQPVERALTEQRTLIVVDNMESILLPPFIERPEALSEEAQRGLHAILQLCARLNAKGNTRLLFTSRETLPQPFDAESHRIELHQLSRQDAVKLVERSLNQEGAGPGAVGNATAEAVEQLVEAVNCHARTLALLGPSLREQGVDATRASLVELMAEMERRYHDAPDKREKSVYASVELSLRRMSLANQEKARVLGVFHGGVDLDMLHAMTEWPRKDVGALALELVQTGLATPNRFNHLTLNPALCPYLGAQLSAEERELLQTSWTAAMRVYAGYLVEQQSQNAEIAATLTLLEMLNLFALLDHVQAAGDAEVSIGLATSLYSLLQGLGKPRLVERVGQVRDAAAASLGDAWNHAQFNAHLTRIEQQLGSGRLREALDGVQRLLQGARERGEQAYPNADYDLAHGCWLAARVLKTRGEAEQALPLLGEAQGRFEGIARVGVKNKAEKMVSICLAESGDCLLALGRIDEAAATYEENIHRADKLGDTRQVAVGKGQLGTVRMCQLRYREALQAHEEARESFSTLHDPGSVAVAWHQTGMVYQKAGELEAAEDAYRKSLAIEVQLGNVDGQARTLNHLGTLYDAMGRTEEAAAFSRQAADKYVEIRDAAKEGFARSNLAIQLRKLRRFDEARQESRRAIECKAQFGHATHPWTSWDILADIETDAGNVAAAKQAKQKAIQCYLAYRRDGGENHYVDGRICLAVTERLRAGGPPAAAEFLEGLVKDPDYTGSIHTFIQVLQAIVKGSRDRWLADDPDLDISMAAEILLLIEPLEQLG